MQMDFRRQQQEEEVKRQKLVEQQKRRQGQAGPPNVAAVHIVNNHHRFGQSPTLPAGRQAGSGAPLVAPLIPNRAQPAPHMTAINATGAIRNVSPLGSTGMSLAAPNGSTASPVKGSPRPPSPPIFPVDRPSLQPMRTAAPTATFVSATNYDTAALDLASTLEEIVDIDAFEASVARAEKLHSLNKSAGTGI